VITVPAWLLIGAMIAAIIADEIRWRVKRRAALAKARGQA
jgi:hypothetical protein